MTAAECDAKDRSDLLASALVKGGRHAEALEQFRLIGRWCGADPMRNSG
jgi:hypothetical protein